MGFRSTTRLAIAVLGAAMVGCGSSGASSRSQAKTAPGAGGTAVKSGGSWKVSDQSFCQLLALQGTKPPGCSKA